MYKRYLFLAGFVIATSFVFRHSLAEILNDKDIFDTSLTQVLASNISEEKRGLAGEELDRFSSEYPNSEYASDAQVMCKLLLFLGACSEGKNDLALSLVNKVEIIINKYPEGKFSDFTSKRYRDVLGEQSSGIVFIPYKYLPVYMRGVLGTYSKPWDYNTVVNNFSLLKEHVDFSKDTSGILAGEVYTPLLVAYKLLGQMEEVNSLVQEVSQKFPDNVSLQQTFNRIVTR